jgi:serine/threonine protein kinase
MITDEGTACIGNFGIAGTITDTDASGDGWNSVPTSKPSVVRYMAPELLDPSTAQVTRRNPLNESDIYSLAMTSYQVCSPHFVACVTNTCFIVTRSSRVWCHMARTGMPLRSLRLYMASDPPSRII